LIPTLRPIAISILLFSSAAAISQTIGSPGNPYTATRKVTFIQKLVDGTTITRVSTTTEARDSQGRTVQQSTMTGTPGRNVMTTVIDPIARTHTTWLSQSKQATRFHMPEPRRRDQPSGSVGMGSGSGTGVMGGTVTAGVSSESTVIVSATGPASADPNHRPTTQSEKLGGKTFAGVYAEGTKLTITYPVGYEGNG
jgi:hypothetical protein